MHLIWQIKDGYKQDRVQLRLMKFIAQQMKFRVIDPADARMQNSG